MHDPVESFILLHGVHAIDLWRFFGGDPVEVSASLSGYSKDADGKTAVGSVLAYARAADGPHGTIHIKAGASHNGDINSDVMGTESRVRVENDQTLTYESSKDRDWLRETMADDVLAGMIHLDQPVGRFVGAGLTTYSYYPDFFWMEWLAFARSLLAGKPLSPSINEGFRTACLTEAICQSLRNGGALTRVNYELRQVGSQEL
jgi:predicted dehydrogenase